MPRPCRDSEPELVFVFGGPRATKRRWRCVDAPLTTGNRESACQSHVCMPFVRLASPLRQELLAARRGLLLATASLHSKACVYPQLDIKGASICCRERGQGALGAWILQRPILLRFISITLPHFLSNNSAQGRARTPLVDFRPLGNHTNSVSAGVLAEGPAWPCSAPRSTGAVKRPGTKSHYYLLMRWLVYSLAFLEPVGAGDSNKIHRNAAALKFARSDSQPAQQR
jgi:hypothetical protein